jgi:ketosteroid isomerase-like protein
MKKLTIALLFSTISFFSLAQTPFTEAEFRAINQRLLTDFYKFLNEEASPDYTFIDGVGGMYNLEQMKKRFASGNKIATWDLSDVKIKQIGNAAMVTGTNKHSIYIARIDKALPYNERFTYTYEFKNNKWLCLAMQHSEIVTNNEDKPEEVVKQWLTEYNKDGKSFFENNCSEDYIASNTSIDGGKFFGREFIINRARKENETNDVETTNMKSFKSGNLAVVVGNLIWHHKQPDGSDKPDKTVSTFIMQKRNGKWWYVGHLISPLKE